MKMLLLAVLALGLMVTFSPAHALTINYNTLLPGQTTTPDGPAPWLTATFEDAAQSINGHSVDGVLLTVDAAGLAGKEFTTDMYFNTTLSSLHGLKYINDTSSVAKVTDFGAGIDSFVAAAGGANNKYDIYVKFSTAGSNGGAARLTDNEIAKIFLYGVSGLNESTFDAGSNHLGYISQAHIQGIGTCDSLSTWVTEGNTPVPEPGTMMLLGVGMLGLAVFGKRRMNSKEA